MAIVYLDRNSTTLGFGTLTQGYTTLNGLSCSTNIFGTAAATPTIFGAGSDRELSLGSADTDANTFVGTVSIPTAVNVYCRGVIFRNVPTGNQTIFSTGTGALVLHQGSPYIDVTANGRLDITAILAGSVNWEKRGASTLRLTNVNTFESGMTLSAGTVEIGNASALGTGTVTMTGGKLSSSSTTAYTLANALSLNGTMTLQDATNTGALTINGTTTIAGTTTLTSLGPQSSNLVFSGVIGNNAGSAYTLTFTGTSDVVLNSASAGTFNGAVVWDGTSGRTLYLAGYNSGTPNQLNGASSITLNKDWQILGNVANTFSSSIGGAGTVYVRNTSASGITFNGAMTLYTGSLRIYADSSEGANPVQKVTLSQASQFAFGSFWFQNGGGLTTLSQTLAYTGNGNLTYGGPLFIYGTSVAPTVVFSNDTSVAGTLVTHTNVVQTANAVTATFRVAANNGPVTFTQVISNPNSGLINLSKTGTYPTTLSNNNAFTGTVTVSNGTLNANNATALGAAASTAAISVTSSEGAAVLSLGVAVNYPSRSVALSGALVIANTGTSTFSSITTPSSSYIRATQSGILTSPITNTNGITFGAASGVSFIPNGIISGAGLVNYGFSASDPGEVLAYRAHTYTGNTQLSYGVATAYQAEAAGSGPFGNKTLSTAGSLLMIGGTLRYSSFNQSDYSGRFSTAGSQQWKIDAYGQTVTYATALVGASSLALSDTSTGGSLTLSSASSTFSGGVTLTSGTLFANAAQSGVSGPLGITGTVTFTPAGTGVLAYTSASAAFDYSSRFATTNGQTRRINANGQSVTFSTAMGGTNAFALVGTAGTLTLAVANTYTQGTTISVGTLKCGNATSLGTGGLAQANNTTLHVTATGGRLTIQGAHTNTGTGSRTIRIGG